MHLLVSDQVRSVAFYKQVFGMEVGFRDAIVIDAGGALIDKGEHAPGIPYAYVSDPDGYVIEI